MIKLITIFKKLQQLLINVNEALNQRGLTSVTCLTEISQELSKLSINRLPYVFAPNQRLMITADDFTLGVTQVAPRAFEHNSNLVSIEIPDSVNSIGDHAFYACPNLISLKIPASLDLRADDSVFENTSGIEKIIFSKGTGNGIDYTASTAGCQPYAYSKSTLKEVIIEEGLKKIGNYTFYNCSALCKVTLPSSLLAIGEQAFRSCSNLKDITIPDSVVSIGKFAFNNTSLYATSSNWKNKVLYISNHLISAKIDISGVYMVNNGTKTVADNAFMTCKQLQAVTVPDGAVTIGKFAFSDCLALMEVILPKSIISIGNYAFQNCSNGLQLYLDAPIPPALGTDAFNLIEDFKIFVPPGCVEAYKTATNWSVYADKIEERPDNT